MTGTPHVRIFLPSTSTSVVKKSMTIIIYDTLKIRTKTTVTPSVFCQQPSRWPHHVAAIAAHSPIPHIVVTTTRIKSCSLRSSRKVAYLKHQSPTPYVPLKHSNNHILTTCHLRQFQTPATSHAIIKCALAILQPRIISGLNGNVYVQSFTAYSKLQRHHEHARQMELFSSNTWAMDRCEFLFWANVRSSMILKLNLQIRLLLIQRPKCFELDASMITYHLRSCLFALRRTVENILRYHLIILKISSWSQTQIESSKICTVSELIFKVGLSYPWWASMLMMLKICT